MGDIKKILIVDDEPDLIDILAEELGQLGKTSILTASDGQDGYRKARNQEFDLVCTDYKMPKLSGAALISALRENRFNKHVPIIVISGFPEEAKAECKKLNVEDNLVFISKPIDFTQLHSIALKMLTQGPIKPAPVTSAGPAVQAKLDVEFLNPFLTAVVETISTVGQVTDVKPEKTSVLKAGDARTADISGTISVVAPLFNGTIYVSFPTKTYLAIVSKMLGETFTALTPDIEDAAAELTNIIYGRARTILNQKNYQMQRGMPSIIKGIGHSVRAQTGYPALVTDFGSSVGPFFVAISMSNAN